MVKFPGRSDHRKAPKAASFPSFRSAFRPPSGAGEAPAEASEDGDRPRARVRSSASRTGMVIHFKRIFIPFLVVFHGEKFPSTPRYGTRPPSFEAGQGGRGEVFVRRFCRKGPSKLLPLFPLFLPASVQEARKKFFAAGKRRAPQFPGRSTLSLHGTNWNSAPLGTVSLGVALFWASRYFGGTLRAALWLPAPAGCRRRCRERSSRRPARTRPLPSAPSRRAWRFSSRDPAFPGSFRRL